MDFKFRKIRPGYRIRPPEVKDFLAPPILIEEQIDQSLYQQFQFRIFNFLKSNSGKKWTDLPAELQKYAPRVVFHRSAIMKRFGLDIGTKNIVLAYQDDKGNVKYRREVNGFFKIEQTDSFAKNMLQQQRVPFIESGNHLIALGEKAEQIAYTFGYHLRRPMAEGTLSVHEKEAMNIMAVIIRSIIGELDQDAVLYYCIPADALNQKTNVAYHRKILEAIVNGYEPSKGALAHAFPINEARAIVLSQLEDKTGIGVSFGAGMVNISYCLFGLPIYEFSLVGSGDYIDREAARVTGNLAVDDNGKEHAKVLVTKAKEDVDLGAGVPSDNLMRAIYLNYEILMEKVARGIAGGFKKNEQKARAPHPMPVVVAGGTSKPDGFTELFKAVFEKQDMPFEIGEITRAPKPLYAVAAGCLVASALHDVSTAE